MTTLATPDWSWFNDPETVAAVDAAARIVAGKYKGQAVNMLAEADDLRQDGYILVATEARFRGLDPALLQFRLTQALNDRVRWGAERATNTVYTSTLEAA